MTSKLPSLPDMLNQLLSLNSISAFDSTWDNSNRAVIDLLAQWLTGLGFHCDIQPLPLQPHKANLVATRGKGEGGLIFAGHTDTVPYDEKGWGYEPFAATLKDDKYYGLGACDMKGFFAVILDLLQRDFQAEPNQPIIVLATADEESSMQGAEVLAAQGNIKGRAAIIGEPTNLNPIIKHKSITMQRISLTGQSGHSSNPELGNSALEAMNEVINTLINYRTTLQSKHQDQSFQVVHPTMNFGCIHGGDSANRICGKCHIDIDLRLLPGMQNSAVLDDIQAILTKISDQRGITAELKPLFDGIDPFEQALDSELVRRVSALTTNEPTSVAFGTEAPYFKQMGFETLVLGPGSIDQAHQPNEFLALDTIKPAQALFKSLITQYCYQ